MSPDNVEEALEIPAPLSQLSQLPVGDDDNFLSQLAHSQVIAGVISLIVAILTSLLTFLDPNKRADEKRTRIWFPMFSYFEANVHGTVPNEFEWPVTREWLASLGELAVERARQLGGRPAALGAARKETNGVGARNGLRRQRHRR